MSVEPVAGLQKQSANAACKACKDSFVPVIQELANISSSGHIYKGKQISTVIRPVQVGSHQTKMPSS